MSQSFSCDNLISFIRDLVTDLWIVPLVSVLRWARLPLSSLSDITLSLWLVDTLLICPVSALKLFVWSCWACYLSWPLVSVTRGLRRSEEVWGGRRGLGPLIDWAQGPRAGRGSGAGPSAVMVLSLSLTVCSQLEVFCPSVKAFSPQSPHCHLGGALCPGDEVPSVP